MNKDLDKINKGYQNTKMSSSTILSVIILVLVIIFLNSGVVIYEARRLSNLSHEMHEHPLSVSISVMKIQANINAIHRSMKDIVLARNSEETRSAVEKVDAYEKESFESFKLIAERFLGDTKYVESALVDFKNWKSIRSKVIALKEKGEDSQAAQITKTEGPRHIILMNQGKDGKSGLNYLLKYAENKALEFREMSIQKEESTTIEIGFIFVLSLVLSVVAILFFKRKIKVENELQESEMINRSLLEGSPVCNKIIDLDFKLRYMSNAGVKLLKITDINSFYGQDYPPKFFCEETQIAITEKLKIALTGKTSEIECITHDTEGNELWFIHTFIPVFDDTDQVKYFLGSSVDITDRKKADKALLNNEETLNIIIDTSPIGICTVDPLGNFVTTNLAYEQMLGYSKKELKSLTIFDITNSDNHIKNKKLFHSMFSLKTKTFFMEKKYICKDNTHIDVAVYATGIVDSMGNAKFGTAFVKDITERLNLEAQLRQSQKMESVGRLAGGIAHDFNNMLSIIIGYGEQALEKATPNSSQQDDIMEILDASNRSTNITRQLLAFARQQTISPKVLDTNDTIENMLNMLRHLIGEDINLLWIPGMDVWNVKIDPSQVDQILANLCVNARDAIDDIGKVTIETKNVNSDNNYCTRHIGFIPGEYVMIAVSDDGSGMDNLTIDKIFEPFFTTKDIGKGTGLGLATVYGIVKQNSGFIDVYSEIDKGTTIKVYLTRHVGKPCEIPYEIILEIPVSQGEVILLVEDNKAILNLSKKILEDLNYIVLAANNPNDALNLAKDYEDKIDLLFTDVVMPEMNGLELSKQLKLFYSNIKVLFMSGYTANVIAHRGILEEGVCFISKPFSKKELAIKIREALDNEIV